MGFKFRKSIKLAPGVKLNVGKKGVSSVSVGGKGATVNVRKDGKTTTTVGIPGSGLSYSETSGGRKRENVPRDKSVSTNPFVFIGVIVGACIFFYYLFT